LKIGLFPDELNLSASIVMPAQEPFAASQTRSSAGNEDIENL